MLVLGRICVRKGVEDVVAVARTLLERGVDARIRVRGRLRACGRTTRGCSRTCRARTPNTSGRVPAAEIPVELARGDVLLQASKYEPFALTVAEALAAGVPVVATSEVGAIEGVDRSVADRGRARRHRGHGERDRGDDRTTQNKPGRDQVAGARRGEPVVCDRACVRADLGGARRTRRRLTGENPETPGRDDCLSIPARAASFDRHAAHAPQVIRCIFAVSEERCSHVCS